MITKNFSFKELYNSDTALLNGIDNYPYDKGVRDGLKRLATELLQPIRDRLSLPILVTSGYRCPELNRLVKGVATSDHQKGFAVDIKCSNMKLLWDTINEMVKEGLVFDQLINEYNLSWIHISLRPITNRMQILKTSK